MENVLSNKRTISIILFLLYLGTAWLAAQEPPRTYIAHKTLDELIIDGHGNEASWQRAAWSDTFIDIEGVKEPTYKTQMKMLWDDTCLYFFAKLDEPHVWATLKKRDTVIFYNNDFEIFIDPDGDTHNYMEFEMNALNTLWDLFLTKPYRNHGKVLDSWDIQGIKTAVHIDGTLNNPNDNDIGWSIEIAIPWEVLKEANTHNNIPVKEYWRFGFSRVNWEFEVIDGRYFRKKDENGEYLPESNWVWSPQGVINMHEPEKWGYVYFSEKDVGEKESFTIPNDEFIKWYMYTAYRELLSSEDNFESTKRMVQSRSESIFGKSIKIHFEEHSTGWNLRTTSPFTGKKLMIKEDGKFIME
ncbi:MAG: carbohydrate-binding family 9-like protein [Maribacter sp.]|nr:carbohydrate-binding family 9-like protein [Maribacter sp.]